MRGGSATRLGCAWSPRGEAEVRPRNGRHRAHDGAGIVTGLLSVVGIGPGAEDLLTPRARAVLQAADVVIGYGVYTEMVRAWLPDARYIDSAIGEEAARARASLELAQQGKHVALVSSGDAGVYGMAGLALELAATMDPAPTVEVVPGVTAAQAAAAILGAPLALDYATIS
ncbi:MAG: cobalt-precorrin-3B C(17)-methyltransferase, partial [Dehalococcoidia bacterium]